MIVYATPDVMWELWTLFVLSLSTEEWVNYESNELL